MISKPLLCAELAACLLSGQQDHCLSSVRLSYLERVWIPQSFISPQLYCTGGGLERLTLTEGAGIAVAALQALRLVCSMLGC